MYVQNFYHEPNVEHSISIAIAIPRIGGNQQTILLNDL